MDYPQKNNRNQIPQDFFTAGPGGKTPDLSDTPPEDNVNLQNFFDNKGQAAAPAHQTIKENYPDTAIDATYNRNRGHRAIFSPEQIRDPLAEPPFKIVDLTPPPGASSWSDANSNAEGAQQVPIRMRGGHLDPTSMKAIKGTEVELSQSGNVTEFYDEVMAMREKFQEAA